MTIVKLQGNLYFLQSSVLVSTVMRVTVTMTLLCVMKVKAKVNQMMTVIQAQAAEWDMYTGPQDALISFSEQELLIEV